MLKKITFLCFLSFVGSIKAFATWSIIIIDPKTKEIGIAAASCSYNCYGIGEIVPGNGAIIVQAMSNKKARKKGLKMIISKYSLEEIITELRKPRFDPEKQQYAIIRSAEIDTPRSYTGIATTPFKGAIGSSGISIQGNTLSVENELELIYEAVIKAQKQSLNIEDVLMVALEAGATAGGDKRCGAQKATSAFITVYKPNDTINHPYLDLNVYGQDKGGKNAVKLLREKYNSWKSN